MLEPYEDAGIEKYIYRSLLELRTCKKCGALDGKSFPVSEQKVGVNMHPMHPNCRCFISPDMTPEELAEGEAGGAGPEDGKEYHGAGGYDVPGVVSEVCGGPEGCAEHA